MQLGKSSAPSVKQNSIVRHDCPTPVAVMDIGTNTIRLLIGCGSDGKVIRIASHRVTTRLGRDVLKTGVLNAESMRKSVLSIGRFKELCVRYKVQKIIAVGTSALREAENNKEFLERVRENTGIDINIISGEEEARLTLIGVLGSGIRSQSGKNQVFLIADIGGGSTEWILYTYCRLKNKKIVKSSICNINMGSIPIGAVKLYETFIKHDPPLPQELEHMKDYISKTFLNFFDISLITHHPSFSFIATGGAATTIAALNIGMDRYNGDRIHMHNISSATIKTIYEELIALPFNERTKLKMLELERADIIISGTLILLTIMQKLLNVKEVIISDYGLLEGAIIDCHVL